MMTTLARIPWIFLIVIYLVVAHQMNLDLHGVAGYAFIGVGLFILFVEFLKSGDLSVVSFMLDTIFAVIAVMASTAFLTYIIFVLPESPSFFHWFGYAIIIGDAIFSPSNAFRTALRNFSGAVN